MYERYPLLQFILPLALLASPGFSVQIHAQDRLASAVRDQVVGPPVHGRRPVPHYKVETVSFRCIDETGYDFAGSDEVSVITRHPPRRTMTISSVFGDVNEDDTRAFGANESCVLPLNGVTNAWRWAPRDQWVCDGKGVPAPLAFRVEMYEVDSDSWNALYECIANPGCPFDISGTEYSESSEYWTKGDDLIGKAQIDLTAADLAARLPNVGDVIEEELILTPPCDGVCGQGWPWPTGPEYAYTFRVTRLPDRPPVEPVLNPHP